MAIYEITSDRIVTIQETTFGDAGVKERYDLQRLLRDQIDIIAPDTLVIAEEFADWADSRRRIDLLGLDKDANLVVFELKCTEDGGHMELQAVRYAAMVSTMTFDQVVEAYSSYLRTRHRDKDPRSSILDFLEWEEPDEDRFAQDVRIVLVSADFSRELTTSVMWLNNRELDVRCVRIKPHQDNGRVLIDVQQVIPLPEATNYQIKIREKGALERSSRKSKTEAAERYRRYWSQLLEKADAKSSLFNAISPSTGHWISTSAGINGMDYIYVVLLNSARVELHISRPRQEEGKRLFDELAKSSGDIDKAFGAPLDWQRIDDKKATRIANHIKMSGLADEERWSELQDAMVDAMNRLAEVLGPYLKKLKS